VKTAGKPPQPIEKSVAGGSLLAQVIVSKIADHLYPSHKHPSEGGKELRSQSVIGYARA
jgi:transposase